MKKLIFLVIMLLSLSLMLAACGGGAGDGDGSGGSSGGGGVGDGSGGDGNGDDGSGEGDPFADYVYAEGLKATIIITDAQSVKLTNSIYDKLKSLTGKAPYVFTDDNSEDEGHEIVIGESNRAVSTKAYRALRTLDRPSDYHVGFVIYAQGNSIALAYDAKYSAYAIERAVKVLGDEIFASNKSFNPKSGVIYEECFSVREVAKQLDEQYETEAWAKVKEALGEDNTELYNALVSYYELYDGGIASWVANLYDVEVGGFYYSNSARDNVGFAPDIESTVQALGRISSFAHLHDSSYLSLLPEKMRDSIGRYIKSLQDPNGYFYNYQWTKESHGSSRLARDLSSAVSILTSLGLKPTYKTPTGESGDGIVVPLPDAAIPAALSESRSVCAAVSKVVLAAHPAQLESADTLLRYLDDYAATSSNFYHIGSNISAMMKQIIARDNELRREYNNMDPATRPQTYRSLVELVINWFNDKQNPETGHWQNTDNYLAVNGILKIMGIYNDARAEVRYAEKMAVAAFNAVTSDELPESIAAIYNTWSAILKILNNLQSFANPSEVDGVLLSGAERAERLLAFIRQTAPDAVIATKDKLEKFKKKDGSFSYKHNSSSPQSQGMPVAVPGTNEGDLNATALATTGTTNSMFTSLGLSGMMVSMYGEGELVELLNILDSLGPVIKFEEKPKTDDPITFEDDVRGEAPISVETLIRSGSIATVESDTDEARGNYLLFNSAANVGDYVYAKNVSGKTEGRCYYFSTDIKVSKASKYFLQISLGSQYCISLYVDSGKIDVREETSVTGVISRQRKLATVNFNEWFNLRVEYYSAGGSDGKPRTKVYINNELVAVSAAYYGQTVEDASVAPISSPLEKATIYIMKSPEVVIGFDNIFLTVKDTVFSGAGAEDKNVAINDGN